MGALCHFDLFGPPFFRSRAVLWSELIWVDQLLSEADVKRNC
jgi:hypothetical protein